MRTPSVKTLARIFGENAKQAKSFLSCHTEEISTPAVNQLRRACHNPPTKYMVRFTALNEIGEFHGVEYCETAGGGDYAVYLNAGDSYVETLIYWQGNYRVQSIGDFVECQERQGWKFA